MNRTVAVFAMFAALVCSGVPRAQTTTLARMDLRELSTRATIVARVRCVRITTWPAGNLVWTRTVFQLVESWKGDPPARFTVRLPGGESAGQRVIVEGAPRFAVGEDAVLFLEPLMGHEMTIVSWAQGTFRIHANPRTRVEEAMQDTAGLQLVDGNGASARAGASPARPPTSMPANNDTRPISVARLRALVARALGEATR
jgi:hypothetical protein